MTYFNNIALLIPAYEPDPEKFHAFLAEVSAGFEMIVVVDDGCSDTSAFAGLPDNVVCLRHAENRGKGAAIKTMFAYLLNHSDSRTKWIGCVTADADGQHRCRDILRVAAEAEKNPDSMILGSRDFHDSSVKIPFRSRFGNKLTEQVFRLCTGRKVRDTQTGLRFYPVEFLPQALEFHADGYEFELESLVAFVRTYHEFPERLLELPIETVYEKNNPTSHFHAVRDSLRIYFVLLRFSLMTLVLSLLDHLTFAIFILCGFSIFAAMAATRIPNLVLYFFLARKYVFHAEGKITRQLPKFLLLAGGLFTASYFGVSAITKGTALPPTPAKILFETALFAVSFLIQLLVVFRRGAEKKGEKR